MRAKYIPTKKGLNKKVLLKGDKVIIDESTTQKNLKKLFDLGYIDLVKKEDAKEDNSESENEND